MNENKEGDAVSTRNRNQRLPMKQWTCRSADLFLKINQVGRGTFGEVYKAQYKDPKLSLLKPSSKFVALKKILTDNEKEGFPITAIREITLNTHYLDFCFLDWARLLQFQAMEEYYHDAMFSLLLFLL